MDEETQYHPVGYRVALRGAEPDYVDDGYVEVYRTAPGVDDDGYAVVVAKDLVEPVLDAFMQGRKDGARSARFQQEEVERRAAERDRSLASQHAFREYAIVLGSLRKRIRRHEFESERYVPALRQIVREQEGEIQRLRSLVPADPDGPADWGLDDKAYDEEQAWVEAAMAGAPRLDPGTLADAIMGRADMSGLGVTKAVAEQFMERVRAVLPEVLKVLYGEALHASE